MAGIGVAILMILLDFDLINSYNFPHHIDPIEPSKVFLSQRCCHGRPVQLSFVERHGKKFQCYLVAIWGFGHVVHALRGSGTLSPSESDGSSARFSLLHDKGELVTENHHHHFNRGFQGKMAACLKNSGAPKIQGSNRSLSKLAKAKLLKCTPDYAYGAGGFPARGIQPNSIWSLRSKFFVHSSYT
ncbi:hypothetical protein OSB04_012188 [Centaurea solstitialis]|uniref:Uncharacterized protein n=1 Tax=Centaurea solstitialis TaxID=347529 RepID=A0AA38TCM4_9ASTR|nr:hypothetical protein OSB04_012188 [Centaurea solstitialis]